MSFNFIHFPVRLTFKTDVLGSSNANPDVHAEFIAAKAKEQGKSDEEVEAVRRAALVVAQEAASESVVKPDKGEEFVSEKKLDEIQKALTVFPRTTAGDVAFFDYQARGYIKEAARVFIGLGFDCMGALSNWSYKQAIDSYVFVEPRWIPILGPDGKPIKKCPILQRPLRAETMQGPRVCLASSEVVPAGSTVEFLVKVMVGNPTAVKTKINKKTGEEETKSKVKFVLNEEFLELAFDYGAMKGMGQWRSGGFGAFTWEKLDRVGGVPISVPVVAAV